MSKSAHLQGPVYIPSLTKCPECKNEMRLVVVVYEEKENEEEKVIVTSKKKGPPIEEWECEYCGKIIPAEELKTFIENNSGFYNFLKERANEQSERRTSSRKNARGHRKRKSYKKKSR